MNDRPTIFFSAAEASGDHHAAGLIAALRQRLPDARIIGGGGQAMAEAGCEVLVEMASKATMMAGPILRIRYYVKRVNHLRRLIREIKPDVVVPVDSPALNWHIAKAAKKASIPVMYYIAPQVWAWARHRVKKLARLTDHVACILPFEQDYLRQRHVNATFIGHPLFDELPPRRDPLPDLDEAGRTGNWQVALLPGSRPGEIASHAPAMVTVAEAISRKWPGATCTFAAVDERGANNIRKAVGDSQLPIAVGMTPEQLSESHFAVVASGTATLLTAQYGVPMVVVYRANRLTYHLVGRWILKTNFLSLANILADREIVPELMPWFGNVNALTEAVMEMMSNPQRLQEARRNLLAVTDPLDGHDRPAREAAADLVIELLQQRSG